MPAMVDNATCIVDTPQPDATHFEALKLSGIEQLKARVGEVWSNYNDSDPGVTILDQLCYALTELGYCAGFPIDDILTGQDGQIRYDGQFFEPQDILTCSPVTPDDYRRLVHDRFEAVEAVYISAERIASGSPDGALIPTGRYLTYVQLRPGTDDVQRYQVKRLLDSHRNLGERFAVPELLISQPVRLSGTITLTASADITQVRSQILQVLKACAVPPVIFSGYRPLREQGVSADDVFNGPKLSRGWINGSVSLPAKVDCINLFDLNARLAAIPGVEQVHGLAFDAQANGQDEIEVRIAADHVAQIDASAVVINRNAVSPPTDLHDDVALFLSRMQAQHLSTGVESGVHPYPKRVNGRYRRIESYYSIQNTFPETYGIGPGTLQSDLPTWRVASSRQLKGYLMVYDQLLANQFSQLAHLGDLFSFRPLVQSLPAIATQDSGLTWRPFFPTYRYQPLYDVPDVMPLLRGSQAFRYQTDPQRLDTLAEQDAWKRFRQHPSNAYLHGLREIMESPAQAHARRDQMLSHLLARHGEPASLYDDLIKLGRWYGSEARTRAVVKSIWLQNYALLSYRSSGAFDPMATKPVAALPVRGALAGKAALERYRHFAGYPTVDGQLDEARVYAEARLTEADLIDFSVFELKVDILLGLTGHLRSLAWKLTTLLDDPAFDAWLGRPQDLSFTLAGSDLHVCRTDGCHELREGSMPVLVISGSTQADVGREDYALHLDQLHWLAEQRKGFLLIEHGMLLPEDDPGTAPYFLSASLVFPDFVSLIMQARFKALLQTLIERHWPAHVVMKFVTLSHTALRALIGQFVIWHNGARNVQRGGDRQPLAAQVMARLLKLPVGEGASHAG